MINVFIEGKAVNPEALDAELRTALGSSLLGLSIGNGAVTVHLDDSTLPPQQNQARTIVLAHDASILTSSQLAETARRQRLTQARQDNTAELDLLGYSDQPDLVRELARKVAWLELEVNTLLDKGSA
ncbi:hypothetical protein ANRL4_02490 [Anaerolineae bacterium]|nr:hypothetical protein ANRL4_02490 [Anaerolineae bacterium]